MKTKKFTKASLKAFIRKNKDNLYILKKSSFDWMTDCVEETWNNDFTKVKKENIDFSKENDFWINGLWLVGWSGNLFTVLDKKTIEIYNCCGKSILKTI